MLFRAALDQAVRVQDERLAFGEVLRARRSRPSPSIDPSGAERPSHRYRVRPSGETTSGGG